jgi:hypothetical protein
MAKMTPEMRETIDLTQEMLMSSSDDLALTKSRMAALTSSLHAAIHGLYGEAIALQWEAAMKKLCRLMGSVRSQTCGHRTKFWNLMADVRLYDKPVAFGSKKAASAGK